MKLPKLWRKRKRPGGAFVGSYYVKVAGDDVNLGTSDANEALERRKQAVKGKRKFRSDVEGAADELVATLHQAANDSGGGAAPLGEAAERAGSPLGAPTNPAPSVSAPPPPPELSPPPATPPPELPPPAGDWHANLESAVAAANVPAEQAEPPPPPEVSDDELAKMAVGFQVWVAAEYARQKVYKGFLTPSLPEEARQPLTDEWKKIIAYAGVSAVLPPWVTQLLIPGVTLVIATTTFAAVFAEEAGKQKKAAGGKDDPVATTETAA